MASDNITKKLNRALSDIRSSFISKYDYAKIDSEIEKSLERLRVSDLNINTINYAETMKQYMTKGIDSTSLNKEITSGILNTPETMKRYARYSNADEVIYNIPQCARALQVLVSGILSPDNVNKTSLSILLTEDSESEEVKEILNNVKTLNKELKFEEYLDTIINETLKYGDKFVEICSYRSKDVPISQSMFLQEKLLYENNKIGPEPKPYGDIIHEVSYKIISEEENEYGYKVEKEIRKKIKLIVVEDDGDSTLNILQERRARNTKKEKIYENIDEIRLIQHDPRRVVKLQSDRHKLNLGYLILPEGSEEQSGTTSGLGSLSAVGNVPGSSLNGLTTGSSLHNGPFMGVDGLYRDLVKLIKKHVNSNDLKVNQKELKELLTRLIKELEDKDDVTNEVKLRYVPPERMVHFIINERINFPYGEGVFEKSMHAAKELIALKTAVTVRRVTDAVDKRVIYIESNLPRRSRNLMTHLREALRKRKFSTASLSNISSIPSTMTSFEDYIITTRNGKRSVEFDTIPTSSSIRDITEELKFFRDELVSSLDVPPAFIGIEENVNGKSTLAHESALFAETILRYQKSFNINIFRFFNNLHKLLYGKPIPESIKVTLQAPKMLYISNELENLEAVSRLLELSNSLGIEKETLRKRYVPFDFEEEEDMKTKEELRKRETPSKKNEDDMLGGGGMGFGGGMGMDPTMGGGGMGY